MKTKKELSDLKEEVETMSKKLHELTDEELEQVVGGAPHGKVDYVIGVVTDATVAIVTAEDIARQSIVINKT